MARKPAGMARPVPPMEFLDSPWTEFRPAPEVADWIRREVLQDTGSIHNPEHKHVGFADFEVLWASAGFGKQMRTVIGQAEQVMFRAGGWQKARMEAQMRAWFGRVPAWLLTFDGSYAAQCSDAEWCALVEHELYHVGHAKDEFGAPAFTKDGLPKIAMRGHDVEEFVGVVKRYGVGDPDGAIAQLAAAARGTPEVAPIRIAQACGTCLLRAA